MWGSYVFPNGITSRDIYLAYIMQTCGHNIWWLLNGRQWAMLNRLGSSPNYIAMAMERFELGLMCAARPAVEWSSVSNIESIRISSLYWFSVWTVLVGFEFVVTLGIINGGLNIEARWMYGLLQIKQHLHDTLNISPFYRNHQTYN